MFLREKPVSVLLILKDTTKKWHLSRIAKATDTTYVYVTHFISILAGKEIVTVQPEGKLRIVTLTDKGREFANRLEEIKKLENQGSGNTQLH